MQESMQLGLDKVRVKKTDLIAKLIENCAAHEAEFEEAHAAWRDEVIVKMRENLALAESKEDFRLHINLPEPENHTRDYERVISMLTASVDEVIILKSHEFQQYHDDEWAWSEHFETLSNTYKISTATRR